MDFEGTATKFANSIKDLPKSTVWSNLRALRELSIVDFGNEKEIALNPIVSKILRKEIICGVVGGFGTETTAKFFERLIELSREKSGGRPRVIIANAAPPDKAETEAINGNVEKIFPFAAECIRKLNAAEVDFIVIPCNTLHIFIDRFREISDVPIVSIIEESVAEIKRKRIKKVGMLATRATINSKLFQNSFTRENISSIIPNEKEQKTIVKLIDNVLKTGKAKESDTKKIKGIISNLRNRGAESILLACTDLQLLISPDSSEIIDTFEVLANASVNLLNHNPAVAQLVERPVVNRRVACASQACRTTKVNLIKPAGDN